MCLSRLPPLREPYKTQQHIDFAPESPAAEAGDVVVLATGVDGGPDVALAALGKQGTVCGSEHSDRVCDVLFVGCCSTVCYLELDDTNMRKQATGCGSEHNDVLVC